MTPAVRALIPVIPVADVEAVLEWYEQKLGAKEKWTWDEPVTYGGCALGAVQIHFCKAADPRAVESAFFCTVANVHGLFEDFVARGVEVVRPVELMPWGAHEFVVRDPNGAELRFAEFGHPAEKREALHGVELLWRKITPPEYSILMKAVNWMRKDQADDTADVLDKKHDATVLAFHEGRLIGMAAIVGNGVDIFVVRDVVVLPEFHGRGVGRSLMREVRAWIDEHVPAGAYVTLLTGTKTTEFYEDFGFTGPDKGLVGMYLRK